MKTNRKNGISLVVLVITIIVIIILAGAVILSLSANNPISQASKGIYLSDLKNFQTELELYQTKQFVNNLGSYNPALLQADNDSVTYNGIIDTSITMKDLIPSVTQSPKYNGQFQIIAGKLIYGGLDTTKQDWTREAGLEVVIIGEPKITIVAPSQALAERGTNIVYTVKFSSNLPLTTVNLAGKVELLDNAEVALPSQPVISIGTLSGIATDTTRQVDITITTNSLANGSYKLKIKPGVVTNSGSISNTIDTISLIGFDIVDNVPPVNPTMAANPTLWTNGNVSVTISYSADSVTKEYSTNGTTWNPYTVPIVVSTNTTTVYAKGKDVAANESGVATLTVGNIDNTAPVVTATNSGTTTSSVTVTAVASDAGGSALNTASYQYSKDNGATWTVASSATSYTFSSITTGTYQCKVKVADNALNATISNVVAITTQGIGTIALAATPTVWTNGNVTVTITYPTEVVTKQYSTNGTTWNTYTVPVVVTANSTTVYAKGLDAGGNQTVQSTLTVANIDKTAPVVTATNGGTTTSSVTVTAVASDAGGSALSAASYQYSKDNGATWTVASSATSYTFSSITTGTYQCKVKVADNALNATISNVVAITTQGIGTIALAATPTVWTNGNVTVTITYPTEVVTKQYSTNGTTWNTYTVPVVVTANSTTVYAKGLDAGGNQTVQSTLTVANIDKTAPTLTLNGNSNINVGTGVAYTEYGVVATDNADTTIQSKVTISGVVNTSVNGTYIIRYNVTDAAGNLAVQITRTVNVLSSVNVFTYTGNVQNFNVPYLGNYKIEVWAAQGGNNWNITGGLGAYSKGTINLTAGKTLYIYVGGQDGYNGGGAAGTGSACENGANGGGATDVRNDGTALTNRFIVAGGGGGASGAGSGHYQGYTGYNGAFGGGGNGTSTGAPSLYHGAGGIGGGTGAGNGGSSGGGDTTSMPTFARGYNGENGTLGQGGAGGGVYGDRLDYYGPGSGSGGGGGYYGGGGGGGSAGWWGVAGGSGGGGSNYIGGVINGQMISGNTIMPNISGGIETGHSGNGYAIITYIGQ